MSHVREMRQTKYHTNVRKGQLKMKEMKKGGTSMIG